MNILITGATGFVGRNIIDVLANYAEHNISIILRNDKKEIPSEFSNKIDNFFHTDDIFNENFEWMLDVCTGIDIVIHCAWYVEHGKYLSSSENIKCLQGSLTFAMAATSAGVKKFIGVGTCLEYDTKYGVMDISTPLNPSTVYASAKASLFLVLRQYFDNVRVDFVWFRLFYLYGKYENENRLFPFVTKKLNSGESVVISNGSHVKDYLDIEVAANTIVNVVLSNVVGAINVCSGVPVSIREIVEKIAKQCGASNSLLVFENSNRLNDSSIVGIPNS